MSRHSRIEWTDATWNPVPGWPGFAVTAEGKVRGPSGQMLRPMRSETGHLYVTAGRRSRKLYVHRAVLLAFVGEPEDGQEARHLNGDPADNCLSNLAWGGRRDQRDDDRRHGIRRGRAHALTAEVAAAIRALRGELSSREVGRRYGVSHTAVQRIWRGEVWLV